MSAELETIVSQLSDTALLAMVDSDPASLLLEAITAANAAIEARGGKAALLARTTPTTKSEPALDDSSLLSPPTASSPTPSPSTSLPRNGAGTTSEPAPADEAAPTPVATDILEPVPDAARALDAPAPLADASDAPPGELPEPPEPGLIETAIPASSPSEIKAVIETLTASESADADANSPSEVAAIMSEPVPVNGKAPVEAPPAPATPTESDVAPTSPARVDAATPAPSADLDQAAIEAMFASDGPAAAADDPVATAESPQEPAKVTSPSSRQTSPHAINPAAPADTPTPTTRSIEVTTPAPSAVLDQAAIEANPPLTEAAPVQKPTDSPAPTVDAAPEKPSPDREPFLGTTAPNASATRRSPKRRRRIILASVATVMLLAAGTFTLRKQWHSAKPMPAQARELPTAQFVAALDHCRSIYEKTAATARSQIAEAMSPSRDGEDSPFTTRLTLVRLEYRRRPTGLPEALERVRTEFETLRHRQELPAALEADFEKFGQIIARHHRFLSQDQSEGLPQWFNDYVKMSAVCARLLKATSRGEISSSQHGAGRAGDQAGTEAGHQE